MILKKSGKARIIHTKPQSRIEERKGDSEPDIILSSSEEEPVADLPEQDQGESSIVEDLTAQPPVVRTRSYRQNVGVINSEKHMTSDELKSLRLQEGLNKVEYVTQTKKKKSLTGRIFFWDENVRIVVSDIDGTLTKSDMKGHLYYFMGKDWSREGVVSLYNEISLRNYKILYVSSRSLSQVGATIGLLNFVDQNGAKLPQGPILLSPDGMFRSIVRELSNYSQNLKETTLFELEQNFPLDKKPFWAGFGNRMGDARAYYNSCIEPGRIFIFDQKTKNDCQAIKNFNEISLNIDEHFPVYHYVIMK
jgi:phosphatidate phosphatase PAH1